MKKIVLCLATLAALCCTGQVQAAAPSTTATPQQSRMKTCAAEYHQKKIAKADYHNFMSKCLKTTPTAK
jgi:hypothetical protein